MDITTSAELYRATSGPVLSFLGVAATLLILLPSAALTGHRVGRIGRQKTITEGKDVDLDAGQASLGGILALLGLLVAFSFGNALNIAEARKTTGVEEAAAVAALFMLGNRSGLMRRNLTWRTFAFAGFLLAVMITIVDLHRGGEGLIRFDQTALLTAIFEMEAGL